jgi:uncharacterized phage protein gp47/JayE
MILAVRNFTAMVSTAVAAMQAQTSALVDLRTGSPLRAVIQATAAMAMWLQSLVISTLGMTRAATSNGADLDTWVADFSLVRTGAVAATGTVTFSRYSATNGAVIVPYFDANGNVLAGGAQVKTLAGGTVFDVTTDTTNAAWSTSNGIGTGYYLPSGTSSVTVPVIADVAGSAGNVSPGAISLLSTSIPGVDSVLNSVAFINGSDQETDAALRTRVVNFFSSLSRGTVAAITAAAQSVRPGLFITVVEGAVGSGTVTVYADDGTGAIPTSTLTSVAQAVQLVRPVGVQVYTVAAITVAAAVNVQILVSADAAASLTVHEAIVANVAQAVSVFVNTLAIGQTLYYQKLASIIFAVDARILALPILTVNLASSDIIPAATGAVVRTSSITVA